MVRKSILSKSGGRSLAKSIEILNDPSSFSKISSSMAFEILKAINKEPMYPRQVAESLKVDEQKVYYHINQMLKAGLIETVKEEARHGAVCKYFAPVAQAFGFELPGGEEIEKEHKTTPRLREFFHEFIKSGVFDGSVVVGAPVPHGPYDTWANDGHYAVQLAMFLGSMCGLENRFIVKTDTEAKSERSYDRNLIVIGGPLANMVYFDLVEKMKIKLTYDKEWVLKSENGTYKDRRDAMIAKLVNPWNPKKRIIVLAGLKAWGTKASVMALTQFYEKSLKEYDKNKDFYCVIRGLDNDGDGKVDDVKILETI